MTLKEMLEKFKKEVCEKADELDADEQDWYALSLGFFFACGATPEKAHDLAREARYKHMYWEK